MSDKADSQLRSALNRLSSMSAGQDQLQADLERIRSDLKGLLVLCLYSAAAAMLACILILKVARG